MDTLALYFNRIHPSERGVQTFEHVPRSADEDASVTIRPQETGTYSLSPFPFASNSEFAFAGRRISRRGPNNNDSWREVLRRTPTEWENFRLVPA